MFEVELLDCFFRFFEPQTSDAVVPYMKSLRLPHVQPVRSSKDDHAPSALTRVSRGFTNNLKLQGATHTLR